MMKTTAHPFLRLIQEIPWRELMFYMVGLVEFTRTSDYREVMAMETSLFSNWNSRSILSMCRLLDKEWTMAAK